MCVLNRTGELSECKNFAYQILEAMRVHIEDPEEAAGRVKDGGGGSEVSVDQGSAAPANAAGGVSGGLPVPALPLHS
jgi:hypothetical protein